MKRFFSVVLVVVMLAVCTSCAKSEKIELPFSEADVSEIELYKFNDPTAAEQKIVTSKEDIKAIIEKLTSIEVKENKLEPLAGGNVTSFRFNLTDGTNFEIIYVSSGVKKGEIKSSYVFDYQTASDVGSIWRNYGEDPKNVGEEVLPVYEK